MDPQKPRPPQPDEPRMAGIVARNIEALINKRHEHDRQKTREEKIADAITRFTGSMTFVYLHIALFGAWIVINLGWVPLPQFDPTFVVLAMVASVEAIFLSTFVLISQNRMAALADKRADLDLQVSLLSEHEVTRLITLVTAIARRLELEEAHDPELHELQHDVAPETVLDKIDQTERKLGEKR